MTTNEIKIRIEELEKHRFYLQMKDRWSSRDYTTDHELWSEIRELKKELTACGASEA